jgi:hypothetical protein
MIPFLSTSFPHVATSHSNLSSSSSLESGDQLLSTSHYIVSPQRWRASHVSVTTAREGIVERTRWSTANLNSLTAVPMNLMYMRSRDKGIYYRLYQGSLRPMTATTTSLVLLPTSSLASVPGWGLGRASQHQNRRHWHHLSTTTSRRLSSTSEQYRAPHLLLQEPPGQST